MKELGDILGTTITHELGGKVWTFSRITLGIMAVGGVIYVIQRVIFDK